MGNAASTVPYGAQSSAVNASLYCKFPNGPGYNLAYVTTTAPLAAGSGQDIYFADLTADFYLNSIFGVAALDIGPHYFTNLTITFDVTNASPSTFSIFTAQNRTFPIPFALDDIPFQAKGAVLGPFGPFTLSGAGPVDLKIKSVNGSVYWTGTSAAVPVNNAGTFPILCDASTQPFEYIVSTVAVDSSTGAQKYSTGTPGSFPPTPQGTRANSANIPIACAESNQISSSHAFNYSFMGTGPAYVRSGSSYNFSNVQNFFTIPGDLAANTDGFYGTTGQTYLLALEAQNIGLNVAGSSPASYDVSTQYTASDSSTPNPLRTGRYVDGGSNQPVIFPLPNWGFLTLPSTSVIGSIGSSISAAFQGFKGRYSSTNTRQGLAGSETLTCTPNKQSLLLSAPIIDNRIAVGTAS